MLETPDGRTFFRDLHDFTFLVTTAPWGPTRPHAATTPKPHHDRRAHIS